MISGTTAVFGIYGHPVEHTFSPGMHNAAFRSAGMNACYVPFGVPPAGLRDAVRAVVPMGLRGLNITVPHKEKVIPYLDELAEDARLIGAVNTIEVRGGRLIGHNTDGRGFLRSLRDDAKFPVAGKTFVIVGSGGAARSIAFCLALGGAGELLLQDIDQRKAVRLAAELRRGTKGHAEAIDPAHLGHLASSAHCIINATPLGLKPRDPLPFPGRIVTPQHLICDIVYNPPETRLIKLARTQGARTLSGIGMLLYQGVIAFEIWTGRKAPVAAMRKALRDQIAAHGK